jgi:DNA-binding MarR family transcriptional regulator
VLGAIALAGRPQPVAWLARDMGNSRQSVQRIVNELEKDGLLAFSPNPHHRRAQLIVLTERGKRVFGATMQLQIPWVNNLADRVLVKDIDVARRVIATLRERLQRDMDVEPDAIRS